MTRTFAVASTMVLLTVATGCKRSSEKAGAPSVAVTSVHHILLEVQDLNRSLDFYQSQMALGLKSRSSDFATLEAANIGIYLWQSRWDWEPPRQPGERQGLGMYPHFAVADVDRTVDKLRKAGYRIVQEPRHHLWGTEAFVSDPDGYVWALVTMHE